LAQHALDRGAVAHRDVAGGLFVLLRADALQGQRFAVQPVGGPIGRDIAAVAPDGAQLLAARRHPGLLAVLDLLAGEENVAARGHYGFGNRRRRQVDLPPEVAERTERQYENEAQPAPEPVVAFHRILSRKT